MLKLLKEDLLQLHNDAYEQSAIDKLELIAWIDSKLQNKSIVAILKEK
ncbi:MAG TPA: hypothetical protein VGK25_02405 [Ignavibacteria bacterium]